MAVCVVVVADELSVPTLGRTESTVVREVEVSVEDKEPVPHGTDGVATSEVELGKPVGEEGLGGMLMVGRVTTEVNVPADEELAVDGPQV